MADIIFEEITPYVEGEGDNGKTAREKINRNFDKLKGFNDAVANITELQGRNEPIAFTESKAMNSFIKALFVDKDRYEQASGVTVSDIYASWNATTKHFYLYRHPYNTGTEYRMLDVFMQPTKPVYCFGVTEGTFFYLEIDTIQLLDSPSIASVPSSSNPRPRLTSWATSHAFDPRTKDGGYTESPTLNKYIKKLWVEIKDDFTGDPTEIINKLTVYQLKSTYNDGAWEQTFMLRQMVGSSQPAFNCPSDSSSEMAFTSISNPYKDKVIIHAVIDWEGLRNDPLSNNFTRTFLTSKAYDKAFWKTLVSDDVGDDSSVALSQKGAKSLSDRIQSLENSGSTEWMEYDSEDLEYGFWNYNYGGSVGSVFGEQRSTGVSGWYSTKEAIEVKAGDIITINTKGGSLGRAYYLTDGDKVVLAVADSGEDSTSTGTPIQLTALEDGYLYVNCATSQLSVFSIRIVRDKISSLINDIEELKEAMEDMGGGGGAGEGSATVAIPKIYNPEVNFEKPTLKILDIGNSFTNNAMGIYTGGTDNLKSFFNAAGISFENMCLYRAIRSGGSFKNWFDVYNDNDSEVSYSITKHFGGLSQTMNGTAAAGDGSKFRSCLQDNTWDVILIHQASDHSTCDLATLEGHDNRGYLKEFIMLLRTLQPSAAIGFLFTHVSNRQSIASNVDTATRFRQMCLSVKQVCKSYDIDFIIPVGAALENLRASSLNTTSNNFSEDNHHLAAGLGKYVAAATYFEAIFAPRYGVSVYGSTFNEVGINSEVIGTHTNYSDNFLAVTPANATKAQQCAVLAVKYPWNISNPDEYIEH